MGLSTNPSVRRERHPQMEVPWVNAGKEKILAGFEDLSRQAVPFEFHKLPVFPPTRPQGPTGEELLRAGRAAAKPRLSPCVCSVFGDPQMLFPPSFPAVAGIMHHAFSFSDSAITHCYFVLAKQAGIAVPSSTHTLVSVPRSFCSLA